MATILEFRRAAGPTSRVTELKDGVPGQIIIFPGVRIERHDAAAKRAAFVLGIATVVLLAERRHRHI